MKKLIISTRELLESLENDLKERLDELSILVFEEAYNKMKDKELERLREVLKELIDE